MHTIHFLAGAIPEAWQDPLPCEPYQGMCCITGAEGLTIPRRKLLSSSFTDLWALALPESENVSVEAWHVFKAGYFAEDAETGENKTRKKKLETMSCWWTDGKEWLVEIDRDKPRLRQLVFQPMVAPWAGYVTRTYKKHGSLRCPVNAAPHGRWGFDDQVVDASRPERVAAWWQRLRMAQECGIPRPLIESVDDTAGVMPALLTAWVDYLAWARAARNDPLFTFLCYLLPSKDERAAGYADEWTLAEKEPAKPVAPVSPLPQQGVFW